MAERSDMTPWGDPDADATVIRAQVEAHGGDDYTELHLLHRLLDARLAGAAVIGEDVAVLAAHLRAAAEIAGRHAVDEPCRFDGMRSDLPGRGAPVLPPYVIESAGRGANSGRVTFSRFHLGGKRAVHGGCQPLLFDDVLGHVTNLGFATIARTAYLHVDYRAVTPYDVTLSFACTLDRVEGRKRFASGRLTHPDGHVLCEAEGLFVELLPGQP